MELDQAKLQELAMNWNPFPVLSQLQAQIAPISPVGSMAKGSSIMPGEWDWMNAGPTQMPGMPAPGTVGAPTPAPGVGAPTPAPMPDPQQSVPLSPQQLMMLQNMQQKPAPPHYAPAVAPSAPRGNVQFAMPSSAASASSSSKYSAAPSLAAILAGRR